MDYSVRMKVIYAVCSWGLGHATRSLPVVRRLLSEGNDLTVISNGRSLELLKKELGESVEAYVDIPDYPMLLSENSRQFMAKSMVYWPMFIRRIEKGLARVTKMLRNERYDVIVSDARYDVYSKRVPSFFSSSSALPLEIIVMSYPSLINFRITGRERVACPSPQLHTPYSIFF